jgi:predicted ester cyclase
MSLEENKAIIHRYTEACNERNIALLKELISPDYFHSALQLRSWEEYIEFETMLWKAFPDLHETNEDIIAEGDKVCYRIKLTGTHTGELREFPHPSGKKMTLAPTGKKMTITAVSIKRIVDGKIVESWALYDLLDFYKQLGVIEYREVPEG